MDHRMGGGMFWSIIKNTVMNNNYLDLVTHCAIANGLWEFAKRGTSVTVMWPGAKHSGEDLTVLQRESTSSIAKANLYVTIPQCYRKAGKTWCVSSECACRLVLQGDKLRLVWAPYSPPPAPRTTLHLPLSFSQNSLPNWARVITTDSYNFNEWRHWEATQETWQTENKDVSVYKVKATGDGLSFCYLSPFLTGRFTSFFKPIIFRPGMLNWSFSMILYFL